MPPATITRSQLHRTLKWTAVVLPLLLVAVVVTAFVLLVARPGWYQPASIDFNHLREDKRALVTRVDRVGEALNQNRPITVVIEQDQANRWLAARDELWPETPVRIDGVESPYVAFQENRVRLAATARRDDWQAVVSVDLSIHVTPDTVTLTCEAAHIGRLPVGASQLLNRLQLNHLDPHQVDSSAGTVTFDNAWIWPNGDRPYRIDTVAVEPGRLTLTLVPR